MNMPLHTTNKCPNHNLWYGLHVINVTPQFNILHMRAGTQTMDKGTLIVFSCLPLQMIVTMACF